MGKKDRPFSAVAGRQAIDYGIKTLRPNNRLIRNLKRIHAPSFYGFRPWPSSWLLMDFIRHKGLKKGSRVLEAGCGWGLTGIYCAMNHGSIVTGSDIDAEVFPYLYKHAEINGVNIVTIKKGFKDFTHDQLKDFDILIGTDICFWDSMVDSLKQLMLRALKSGVQMILIADPGRAPFEELGRYFSERHIGTVRNWNVLTPYPIRGRILSIGTSFN